MRFFYSLAFVLTTACTNSGAAEIVIDSPMESDPAIELPGSVKALPPSIKALWIDALEGADVEMKLRAAEAIARTRLLGLDDMRDAVPHLRKTLAERSLRLPVRLAIARALAAVDAREAAAELYAQAGHGELEMQQIVEPALAAWDFAPIRAEWLGRLNDQDASHPLRLLAIRGLGAVKDQEASDRLLAIAVSTGEAPGLRLEAAQAVAELEAQGLEREAEKLAGDASVSGMVDRLVAASLLKRHRSEQAVSLLKNLAVDPEPAVAAVALQWLLDTDPALIVPIAGQVVGSRDANVRRLGGRALAAVPSGENVAMLGPLLDDPHPDVRAEVRDALFRLAERPELAGPVREAGMRELNGDGWRGPEQASMLLGALDHEPAADRLLDLLDHPRPEVMVASAWALRRLAIAETLPRLLEIARSRHEELRAGQAGEGVYGQVPQIFQMFGQMTYRPAEPLLREFVPKNHTLGSEARAAAVWALGHFHAGTPDEQLVPALEERLSDFAGFQPEAGSVRRQAAVALGRMRAEQALPTLQTFSHPQGASDAVGGASNWAITQITGETFPKGTPRFESQADWFLVPL